MGIDSVMQPYENRLRAWQRIGKDLPMDKPAAMISPAVLADMPELGSPSLTGKVQGRGGVDVRPQSYIVRRALDGFCAVIDP